MAEIIYTPGVCNIGREEISRRMKIGWIGLAVTIVLAGALIATGVGMWWRLFIFLPAALSATGFLQAYFHFCPGFARQGAYNLKSLGSKEPILDEDSKKKDRARGNRITLYSALIGAAVAIVLTFI